MFKTVQKPLKERLFITHIVLGDSEEKTLYFLLKDHVAKLFIIVCALENIKQQCSPFKILFEVSEMPNKTKKN